MNKNRLEAFSDGVLAIAITIMVLEIKIPEGHDLAALVSLAPVILSYVLSFIYLGIYWNNHHHMLHTVRSVNGEILWANLHLLFWLSLVPFGTRWIGETHFTALPMAIYGVLLFMSAVSYFILQTRIVKGHGPDSILAKAIGADFKGKISIVLYMLAIASCWIHTAIAGAIYILVAFMWLIPDRRIESILQQDKNS